MDCLLQRLIKTWDNKGTFYTHINPDVDAYFSIILIYRALKHIINIDLQKFITDYVKLIPSTQTVSFPDFGVDIGDYMDENNIKYADPVMVDDEIVFNVSCSLYLAMKLLTYHEFNMLKPIIMGINTVDVKGTHAFFTMKENNVSNSIMGNINPMTLWGIVGTQPDFNTAITLLDNIIESHLIFATEETKRVCVNVRNSKVIKPSGFTLIITPMNSGRATSNQCFKRPIRADAVIFSTFNKESKLGTIGVSLSKSLFTNIKNGPVLRSILQKTKRFAEIPDLYITDYILGRVDKSPFITEEQDIILYVEELENAMKTFLTEVAIRNK